MKVFTGLSLSKYGHALLRLGCESLIEQLHDLAQWAFGPQGLPSLEAIICGDFSYDGRYDDSNVFLSRSGGQKTSV